MNGSAAPALVLALSLQLGTAHAAEGHDCLIEPWQTVEVRAAVEGIIEAVAVDRGDAIRRGQALVVLQSAAEKAAVEAAAQRAKAQGQIYAARNR